VFTAGKLQRNLPLPCLYLPASISWQTLVVSCEDGARAAEELWNMRPCREDALSAEPVQRHALVSATTKC